MNVSKETVTPKKAMEWLKRNINNRPLRAGHVDSLAAAISAGEFFLNGETVKFNGNGDLFDGQHRLHAIIQSGKAIETYVVRGVPHDAFDTIDTGARREVKDAFARRGEKNYSHLATAVRVCVEIEKGASVGNGGARLRNTQASAYLDKHPRIRESVQFASDIDIKKLMSVGQCAALHFLMSRVDADKATAFWKQVAVGEGLTKKMPTYALRERLIENRSSKAKLRRFDIVALAIKAWNHYLAGNEVRCLKVAESEAFPKIQ